MRFIVDAQLPRRFAAWLRDQGHDALANLASIVTAFTASDFIELNRTGLIVHS